VDRQHVIDPLHHHADSTIMADDDDEYCDKNDKILSLVGHSHKIIVDYYLLVEAL